ncbi:MAG: PilZ domain-containing protein [Magnetococcales bacterium]|nr:PilZ domain-containing protein [Magnetococcales bacterium]
MEQHSKRTSVRLPYQTSIRLKMNGVEWSGHIENFSTAGILVRLNKGAGQQLPPLQSQGTLIFQVDGVSLESAVTVVRASGEQLGLAFMSAP